MILTTQYNICIYNIIFYIINFILKILIRLTFGYYINYNEVNINYVYHIIILKMIDKIERKYKEFFFKLKK